MITDDPTWSCDYWKRCHRKELLEFIKTLNKMIKWMEENKRNAYDPIGSSIDDIENLIQVFKYEIKQIELEGDD